MTALDDKLVPKVKALITKFAVPATLSRKEGTHDDNTGLVDATPTVTDVNCTPALRFNKMFDQLAIDSEFKVIIDGDFEPLLDDELTINGNDYTVLSVSPLYAGLLVAAYILGVK